MKVLLVLVSYLYASALENVEDAKITETTCDNSETMLQIVDGLEAKESSTEQDEQGEMEAALSEQESRTACNINACNWCDRARRRRRNEHCCNRCGRRRRGGR